MVDAELRTRDHTVTDRPQPASVAIGFLTVIEDPTGWVGGYLVTNAWGRPLEFRLTSAVQPNRVQIVLYGPTLEQYLYADVIGKTLVEKTSIRPDLIVTDCAEMLGLRSRIDIPVIGVALPSRDRGGAESITVIQPNGRESIHLPRRFASDEPIVAARLEAVDPAVDLSEPFARIREAVAEARRMGVSRAA
jgi:hypothetical protein